MASYKLQILKSYKYHKHEIKKNQFLLTDIPLKYLCYLF